MLKVYKGTRIFISTSFVDMRKAINGLSCLVKEFFNDNPQSKNIYVFFGKTKDKVKILYWDTNGFVLHYKKICKIRFKIPKYDTEVLEITEEQLSWLLSGLDFDLMAKIPEMNYSNYC